MFKNNLMLKKITSKLDINTLEVLNKSISSSLVKISGMMAGVFVSIFLGRFLGAEGFGIINLVNRIVLVIITVALLGMQPVIVKKVSIAYNRLNWERIGNSLFSAFLINGIITIVLVIVFIYLTPYIANNIFQNSNLETPLLIGVLMIVPMVASRLLSSGLIGFKKIWQSNLVNNTLSAVIVALLLLISHFFKIEINVVSVAIVYAISRLIVFICVSSYWRTIFKNKSKNKYIGNDMLKMALPMFLVTFSAVIASNADGLMLGWLGNASQVGLYAVAAKVALLTSFFLQVTNAAIAPKVAALFEENKINELEIMVQKVTFFLFIIGLLSLLLFLFFGNFLLSMWGNEFNSAYSILIILSIGQFFNLTTGAVGVLLVMTGHENILSKISISFLILNLVLNFIFIYKFGALGAAISTAICVISQNLLKLYYVKIKLNINTVKFSNFLNK
tara:strand:- start:13719 stop:15059 length:1341 start_codon:yes stop_codon:yes gene_type:complete